MKEITKKGKILEFLVAALFILTGVGLRLVPHAPNFTPIAAIALFGGVYFSKKTAFILPVLAMAISDMFLGFYEPKIMIAVYGSFIFTVILGFCIKKHRNWKLILGGSILSSFVFFILTNFAVWAFSPWYDKTLSGLIQCYILALPFFRNGLLGDVFYTSLFFGVYELIEVQIRKRFEVRKKNIVFA